MAPGGDILGHDRPRARVGVVTDLDRRDQRGVDTGVHAVADRRAVLVLAVVVGGYRAGTQVHTRSDIGVADVRQVRDLRSLPDLGVLDLDVGPDLHPRRQARSR